MSFDKVIVVDIKISTCGDIADYGSSVDLYPFNGNFDTFENFKNFITNDYYSISRYWVIKDEVEKDKILKKMYNDFLEGRSAGYYFYLEWDSSLKAIDFTIRGITDEPIKNDSYIKVTSIEN